MLISIIIPNFNGAKTLHQCLEAATSLEDEAYEVIVVDDGSQDNSVEIIEEFDCRLVRLEQNCGTSHARNMGAKNSRGDLLFFTDSDCVLPENTLGMVRDTLDKLGPNTVLGGTYTIQPHDDHFFSRFQSVYIHYSETKHSDAPDYLASHALVIDTKTFNESGGLLRTFSLFWKMLNSVTGCVNRVSSCVLNPNSRYNIFLIIHCSIRYAMPYVKPDTGSRIP